MMTSSPWSWRAWTRWKRELLAPAETMICLGAYSTPKSSLGLLAVALRRARRLSLSVYLVKLSRMALIPASLTFSGVGKSGSPTLRSMTSMPSAFMALALAEIFRVGEAPMRWTFSEIMVHLPRRPAGRSLLRVFGLGRELGLEELPDVGPRQGLDDLGHLGQDLGDLARDLGRAEVLVPADDDDLVDLGEGLRHGFGQLGQDLDVAVEDGGLGVFLPGLGLLHHGLGLGAALGPDLVGRGQPLELEGFGLAFRFGDDPVFLGLGLGLDLVLAGVGRLDDGRLELLLLAGDLEALDLDGLFLLDLLDLGLLLLEVLAQAVALEIA